MHTGKRLWDSLFVHNCSQHNRSVSDLRGKCHPPLLMYSFHILFLRRHIFDNKKLEMAKCQNFTHSSNFETDAGQQGKSNSKVHKRGKSFVWHFRVSVFFILLWLKDWKWDVMCVLSSGEMSGQVMQPAFDSTEFVNWHFFLTFSFWF